MSENNKLQRSTNAAGSPSRHQSARRYKDRFLPCIIGQCKVLRSTNVLPRLNFIDFVVCFDPTMLVLTLSIWQKPPSLIEKFYHILHLWQTFLHWISIFSNRFQTISVFLSWNFDEQILQGKTLQFLSQRHKKNLLNVGKPS